MNAENFIKRLSNKSKPILAPKARILKIIIKLISKPCNHTLDILLKYPIHKTISIIGVPWTIGILKMEVLLHQEIRLISVLNYLKYHIKYMKCIKFRRVITMFM